MIGKVGNSSSLLLGQRLLRLNQLRQQQSLARLATGRRLNSGADDPAGLIASETLSATIAALEAETAAVERTRAVAATADAALGETSSLLTEAKRLAVANADGTISDAERQANQAQIDSIVAGVDRIANTTQFAGRKLLDGNVTLSTTGASQAIAAAGSSAIGSTEIAGTTHTLDSIKTGGDLAANKNRGEDSNAVIDQAIKDVSTQRARIGAFSKNVLGTRVTSLSVAVENLSAARSIVRDTDYAAETAQRVRTALLASAGVASMRWLMTARRSVLSLLG